MRISLGPTEPIFLCDARNPANLLILLKKDKNAKFMAKIESEKILKTPFTVN